MERGEELQKTSKKNAKKKHKEKGLKNSRSQKIKKPKMNYKTAAPDRYGIMKEWARENRRNATLAEQILWEALRNRQTGRLFLRQHIIGDYIVDFLCRDDGLIIEVDGGYHNELQQQEDDALRTQWLESQGYSVMRFSNEEICNDLERVLKEIEKFFND